MRSFTNLVWKSFGPAEPHCPMTFLEIFSSKKFSRVVVYCSVIKVPVVLFSRQLWYFIKSLSLCQELFYFSFLQLRFPLGPLQATACIGYHISKALSTVFFICFFSASSSSSSASMPPAVPPPRLRLAWFSAAFQVPVISDRCYLITAGGNCQCFFCFLFISDNSHNSDSLFSI